MTLAKAKATPDEEYSITYDYHNMFIAQATGVASLGYAPAWPVDIRLG